MHFCSDLCLPPILAHNPDSAWIRHQGRTGAIDLLFWNLGIIRDSVFPSNHLVLEPSVLSHVAPLPPWFER